MRDAVAVATTSVPSNRDWVGLAWKSLAWGVLIGSIIYYVRRDALHYLFQYSPDSFKAFWSERILIRMHVACAVTMISTGTLQFWTGLRMRNMTFHVWCGRVFLLTGTFVGCSALYMGLHPRLGGIVYGFGLFLNGLFWLAAASIAFYEKVIKVKADVAALLCLISVLVAFGTSGPPSLGLLVFFTFLVLCGFRHISTENLSLGSLRSDDWQLGRPTAPPVLSVLP